MYEIVSALIIQTFRYYLFLLTNLVLITTYF